MNPYPLHQRYRPSNGTDGDIFVSQWCSQCIHEQGFRDGTGDGCAILAAAFAHDVDSPEYPMEWTLDSEANAECPAFVDEDEPIEPLKATQAPRWERERAGQARLAL